MTDIGRPVLFPRFGGGRHSRTDQASQWVAMRDRRTLMPDEQARFDRWLQADSRNLGAYVRAQAIYRTLNYTAPVAAAPALMTDPDRKAARIHGRRRVLVGAAAACAVGLTGQSVPPDQVFLLRRDHEAPRRYRWRGATLTLDALSAAYVPDTGRVGHAIRFLSGRIGVQATDRPIHLSAGPLLMQATHADFDLAIDDGRAALIAYAGTIAVSVGSTNMLLKGPAFYHLPPAPSLAMNTALRPLSPADILSDRAWRDAQAVLNDTRLADAAAQFNRYSRTRIMIESDRIARSRVTGSFDLLRPVEFARSVQKLLRCRLSETGDRIVLA
ncbi:DUF4880 domain-containing protein [Gluconacetobacter tumulicola]|uniref:DUF4880 domain-containing protein n=1 Tax=Gluconacetobacter tumulicola TaxID=1017177 RepID=A0A7W4P5J5_9PROT|nr:DUF4880 domain-containing protein [Gluconacetobacter tumulicola]MBB2178451.1 DUF4880 domain-containing protein [Gluconacetobacter tumulicola]